MKRLVLISLLILAITSVLPAQTASDALRYSRLFYGGTARFNALGGAFGAVGADFSVLATNPAGIGVYQGSEMSLTFAPMVANSTSEYNGFQSSDNRVSFGMGNFGYIFTIKTYDKNKSPALRNFNIGFGVNRQNDFSNRIYIQGPNHESSMLNVFTDELNDIGEPPEYVQEDYPFDAGLAYAANLIWADSATGKWHSDMPHGGAFQTKEITTYGSINELDVSFGGNISNTLYFGMTIGVPFLRYFESSRYQELDLADTIPEFNAMTYTYNLETHGTGFNVKAGVIFRPINWFRLGLAVHSPTWYPSMSDVWSTGMESYFTTTSWNSIQYSPVGTYDYKLMTPFRAFGSVAFIIGQYGLISADYEYVNYSQARFNSTYDSYQDINDQIKSTYMSWGNIRVGTEWRIQDFRIRGGFAYFSNPYQDNLNNSERYQVSGGLGYRSKYFFADVSYVWSQMKENYYLYNSAELNPSLNTYHTHTVLTTVGFRF
jgi:hypothetical protein